MSKRKTFHRNKARRERVKKEQLGVCQYCGASEREEPLTVDHIMPLARGGTNDAWNLQTLCEFCNNLKDDKYPFRPPPREQIRRMKEIAKKKP